MSIYRNKVSDVIVQDCIETGDAFIGSVQITSERRHSGVVIEKINAEQLFTEQECCDNEQELLKQVNELKEELSKNFECACEYDFQDMMTDRDKLIVEVERLKQQNKELVVMIPQPVEISPELADVIKYMKERSSAWEGYFLFKLKDNPFFSSDSAYAKLIKSTSYTVRLNIIKNGYTIKPKPTLRQKLAKALDLNEETSSIFRRSELDAIMNVLKQEGFIKDEDC